MSDDCHSGAMQHAQRISPTVSGSGSSQNLFFEMMGKGEKAILLAVAFISLAICVYSLSRVNSLSDSLADYKATSQQHTALLVVSYQNQTETLIRQNQENLEALREAYQHRTEALKDSFDRLDRQYRMEELKYDDMTVTLHRAGLVLPGDYTRGPQGNLDAESFHIKTPKGVKRE